MHSTSRYVKHWRYRPLALACLLACLLAGHVVRCVTRLPRIRRSRIHHLARPLPGVDRRKWPRVVVDPRSCLSATSRLWISWVWLLRCDWPARSARDGLSALEVVIGLALESCEDIRSAARGGKSAPAIRGIRGIWGIWGIRGIRGISRTKGYMGYIQSKGVYGVYPHPGGKRGKRGKGGGEGYGGYTG